MTRRVNWLWLLLLSTGVLAQDFRYEAKVTPVESFDYFNIELSPEELSLLRLEKEEENFEKLVGKENLDFFYQNFTYQQLHQLYNL